MPLVERTGVAAVEVAHAVGEVGERRLDDEVVVVPEQAACVQAPAVAPPDASQDLDEDDPVPVVEEDGSVVVPLRCDVVVGAVGEVALRSSHRGDRTAGEVRPTAGVSLRSRVSHTLVTCQARDAAPNDTSPRPRETSGAKPRLWSARGAGATGSSRARAAACAGTACPSASSRGSARRRRRARPLRSAPR